MPVAAVDFYDVIRWIHITAVVLAFGPAFAFGILLSVAERRDPRSLPVVFAAIDTISRSLVTLGAIVVFATGIYLTIDGPWSFGDVFINVGMLALIVLIGAVHVFFIPNDRRAAEIAARDIEEAGAGEVKLSPEFDRINRRGAQAWMLAGLTVILVIYFMTAKPFF